MFTFDLADCPTVGRRVRCTTPAAGKTTHDERSATSRAVLTRPHLSATDEHLAAAVADTTAVAAAAGANII